jgi:hypothetical protein
MNGEGHRLAATSSVQILASVIAARRFALLTLGGLIAVFAFAEWIKGDTYSSNATFLPQSGASASSLAGLATQLGFSLPGGSPGQSSPFFVELIGSTTFLASLV